MMSVEVTVPGKTNLIYTKYTYSYYGIYLFFCVCYTKSVSFVEFLRKFYIYDEICVKILAMLVMTKKKISRVDKTASVAYYTLYSCVSPATESEHPSS